MTTHCVLLLLAAAIQVQCQQEYTLPSLGHGIQGETYDVKFTYQMVDTVGSGGTFSTDTGISSSIPVAAAVVWFPTVDETHLPIQSQLKNWTRTITTSIDVSLQVITEIHGHSEGYQALPNDKLGTEYHVSTLCAFGGYCQVVIGSTVDGTTQVYVNLPAEVDEIGFCIKNGTWYSKSNTTITLNYPEVVQLETTHDLTGTRIYSDNPVAVIVGSRTATGSSPMYHLAEQLVPVPEWGTEFFVRPFGTNAYGNIVHITSRYRKTFVTMDGFRTVELTGYGQTIKRRIVLGSAVKIKASQPVQVMLYTGFTYASNETIVNPGMTLVPAKEHWHDYVRFGCHANTPNDVIQVIHDSMGSLSYDGTFAPAISVKVCYTNYTFAEYVQTIPISTLKLSHSSGLSGIMTCNNTAIFPLRSLALQHSVSVGCITSASAPTPNDGLDNDCDGSIDEDICYENRMFAAGPFSMVNHTFVGQRSYQESIVDFTLIKFRLRSCGDVKVELLADGGSKLVISISKVVFTVYKCLAGSGCTVTVFSQTASYTTYADCNTIVPYWINKNSIKLCMGVGPFPDYQCSDPTSTLDVTSLFFTDMIMFGLHSNAVFYYDLYRSDCGGLQSDWRCSDNANNCWEYESDLCTIYVDWAHINCQKFCGFYTICVTICGYSIRPTSTLHVIGSPQNYAYLLLELGSPDSVGKMFVVIPPPDLNVQLTYTVIERGLGKSPYNSVSSANHSITFDASTTVTMNGSTINKMSSAGGSGDRVYVVYTSSDSHLTVMAMDGGWMSVSITAFPIDALGTEYMTLSFFNDTRCTIASVEGPTRVWLYSKTTAQSIDIDVYHDIFFTSSDYVGTVILSSRPVAVFCERFGEDASKHNWYQLMPTSSWGTEYYLPALDSVQQPVTANIAHDSVHRAVIASTTVRILANSANTKVEISGDFQAIEVLEERGDYLERLIDSGVNYTIKSNFPVAIAVKYEELLAGLMLVLIVPSVDSYMDSPAIFYSDNFGSVYFSTFSVDGIYTSDSANVRPDIGLFYQAQTSASFVMSVYQLQAEYYYNGPVHMSGHLVKDLQTARICTVTRGIPGDGIDNDCDGLVDEEVSCRTGYGTYDNDTDLDADFGEDCLVSTAYNALVPPAIPICLRVAINPMNENDTHCWAACTCPCDWIDDLNVYKNMTPAERNASNLEKIKAFKLILTIDKTILSTKVAEKQSAEDSRASSANIGIVGIVLLTLVFCLIGFMDFVNVIRFFRNMWKASSK